MLEESTQEPAEEMIRFYRDMFKRKLAQWPDSIAQALGAQHVRHWATGMAEGTNLDLVSAELRAGGALPEIPVIVMTASGLDQANWFLPDQLQQQMNAARQDIQAELAASTPYGRHVVLADLGHAWLHVDAQDAVRHAILELVTTGRA